MFEEGVITKTVVFIDDGERYIYLGDPSGQEIQLLQLNHFVDEDGHMLYCSTKSMVKGLKLKLVGETKTKNNLTLVIYSYSYTHELKLYNRDLVKEEMFQEQIREVDEYVINQYCKYALIKRGDKITVIDEYALNRVSAENNYDVHDLRELLLKNLK